MIKLVEKVEKGNLTAEEKGNLVLSLIKLANEGKKLPGSIDNYLIDDKCNIAFLDTEDNDLTLAAPEYFVEAKVNLTDKSMFSVGLLAYYIYNGTTYYEASQIDPLDIVALAQSGDSECLINSDELSGAYAGFTAWKAEKRHEGAEAFFQYINANFKCRYSVNYICDGSTVKVESGTIVGDIEEYPATDTVKTDDGTTYTINQKCKIPYRLGHAEYNINVTSIKTSTSSHLPDRVTYRQDDIMGTTITETTSVELPARAKDVNYDTKIVGGKVQPIAISMDLPHEIRNLALIEFVFDNNVILKKEYKNISTPIADYPFGGWITSTYGADYITLATTDIQNVDGAYKYTIPTKKAIGKIETYIMLEGSNGMFHKLICVGAHESNSFTCYADRNGFKAPLVGGYVDSGTGEVIFWGPIGLTSPGLATERKVRVTVNSRAGSDFVTIDAVEVDSGTVLFTGRRINMPKSQHN